MRDWKTEIKSKPDGGRQNNMNWKRMKKFENENEYKKKNGLNGKISTIFF